ncbi:SIMPL domain-containing protein [Paenibacillus filicis]|uniref:SIMPL domain-containing protein n=1 Tax=Paenibacillus gyeongsangnamensis TaxID=3388067 RepID=A0ABT4Q9L3_9BACL|nr:SIMPL domain-containing protein [Paenibacillus filicis]MCZ8513385.1 SIMPL domain-containing protein [Paenibacillus filicis]
MKLSAKNWLLGGLTAVALVTISAYTFPNASKPSAVYAANQTSAAEKHAITVNGVGELMVTPDVAYVTMGIVTKADSANSAQTQNAQNFANLEKVLYDNYKLEKQDVKTIGFQVQPVYSYADKEPKITGYRATQTVQVTYRSLDKIGELLDAASGAGVNQISGVQFDTEKRQDYEIQAIDKAMSNAESKAKAIAKDAGKELKGVINVSQLGNSSVPVRIDNVGAIAMEQADVSNATTSISPGQLKITTNVTVQYDFQ